MERTKETIYDRIRKLRVKLCMSQEELALKVGYTSRSTIHKIELGKIDLPNSKIPLLAKALRTSTRYLMDGDEKAVETVIQKPAFDIGEEIEKATIFFDGLEYPLDEAKRAMLKKLIRVTVEEEQNK